MHVKSKVHEGFGIEMSSNPWRVTMTLSGAGRRANADRVVSRKVFEPERGDQAGVNELWSKVVRDTEGYWNGSAVQEKEWPAMRVSTLEEAEESGDMLQEEHDTEHRHYFRQDGTCRCGESQ